MIRLRRFVRALWRPRSAAPVPRPAPTLPNLYGLGLWLRADTMPLANGALVVELDR